jgi:DNA-binding NarL/FixJ family response regulator
MEADRGQSERQASIVVVSEVRFLSDGLAEAIGRGGVLSVSGYCCNLEETLVKIPELRPDIVLLDAAVPDAIGLVSKIHKLASQVRVVVLALAETAESVITWAEVGVAGYIPRTASLADITPILLGIIRGEQVCSRSVAAALIRHLCSRRNPLSPLPALTPRETQIIELIGAGLSNKEIARHLNIRVTTTKSHVHNVLGKLNVQRRSQVALWTREHLRGSNSSFRRVSSEFVPKRA